MRAKKTRLRKDKMPRIPLYFSIREYVSAYSRAKNLKPVMYQFGKEEVLL